MKQTLIDKILNLQPVKRQFLFAGLELFHNIISSHTTQCNLDDFQTHYSKDLIKLTDFRLNSTDISQLYEYATINTNNGNLYNQFKGQYLR